MLYWVASNRSYVFDNIHTQNKLIASIFTHPTNGQRAVWGRCSGKVPELVITLSSDSCGHYSRRMQEPRIKHSRYVTWPASLRDNLDKVPQVDWTTD